jgi:HK97 family phage major capsid protein
MPDLALLNSELTDMRDERALLRQKHPGATMPEEARARDEEIVQRMKKVTFLIEEAKQGDRDRLMEETAKYMDDPQYQISRAVNDDDQGIRELNRAGWEVKGGQWTRQTTVGEFAMYPEEVLHGPVNAKDKDAADYINQVRRIMQPDYRAAWINYIRNCATSRSEAMAMARLTIAEQNALSEGTESQGGVLVPPDVQSEILARVAQLSVMQRICRVVTTTRDQVRFPAVSAHASSGSLYSSGFVGTWAAETPAFSETDPAFETFEVAVKKIRVATKMSNDWLADAGGNMIAFLAQNGAENMALVRDDGLIAGTGANHTPVGLLNSGLTTGDVEGSTANTISNTTTNAGSAPKITALQYLLPAQYASGASFLMRRAIEGDVRALVDGNGRPYWLEMSASGFGATPGTIGGAPVYNSDSMPNDGSDTNKVMVFGNFQNYIIVQRQAITTTVLRERFADTDQTGIILSERVGGGVWNTDAFRIGVV